MRKTLSIFVAVCGFMQTYGQQPPINDTLIPKQHLDDTVNYEPKLQGGALIDTVNIKDKPDYQPGYVKDTSREKNSGNKPKQKQP